MVFVKYQKCRELLQRCSVQTPQRTHQIRPKAVLVLWKYHSRMNSVLRVPGGGHRNLRVPDLYTSILRVPKATQTYSTCSDWRPSKNILPHVFLREKLQFTCSTYDLPPLGILSAILGVPICGATSCTCSSVRVLAHIFPTCSTSSPRVPHDAHLYYAFLASSPSFVRHRR